jgi:hypothetical protein
VHRAGLKLEELDEHLSVGHLSGSSTLATPLPSRIGRRPANRSHDARPHSAYARYGDKA